MLATQDSVVTRPAEYIDQDGDLISWYCGACGRELGADLDAPDGDGMPPTGCPEHGIEAIAWETWNVVSSPTYPHRTIDDTGREINP